MTDTMEENLANLEAYLTGEEKGIEKNQLDVIKKMYQKKFDLKIIAEALNMPIEKIKNIINNIKNEK